MKFSKFLATAAVVLLSSLAQAEIRESVTVSDVLSELDRSTVVVFDLDNTVMEPVQTLGSDQFFEFLRMKAESRGLPKEAATQWALKQATPIQPASRVRAVEKGTPGLIKALQARGVPIFALTARPPAWARGTLNQLASLGVDFRQTAPRLPDGPLDSENGSLFVKGVLFQRNGGDKGQAMLEFLREAGWRPAKILFIDDKPRNVANVEAALDKTPICHISFRYGATDPRVKSFDPRIAEIQWSHFRRTREFISDEEALSRIEGQVESRKASATR